MKSNLSRIGKNILFALNVFIAFILIFENKLVVPVWLQPVGRLHPMLLHFPIAILMATMLFEIFESGKKYRQLEQVKRFTDGLLLVCALFSGVTVLMGLFLSREEGYDPAMLLRHKWTGASIFFLSTLMYVMHRSAWYKPVMVRSAASVMLLCIVFAGHFGSVLTHGENYVLQPVTGDKKHVPFDQALVFEHVIKPVFEEKCVGCHNASKLKGELMLTDRESIEKGGKSGKLFQPGRPDLSSLLERIHLPPGDKKHMPPKGKTQLTPDEISLFYYWIRDEAGFDKKVTDLPVDDSLRIISALFLDPPAQEEPEMRFDFPPADEKLVGKLNKGYRAVSVLAKGSPALSVSYFNSDMYSSASLEELLAVKDQIVSLDLNKMPAGDGDLKIIGQFRNLRTLNLSFTEITGRNMNALLGLGHLKTLSVSGTKLDMQAVQQLLQLKELTELVVWKTALSDDQIRQLRNKYPGAEIIGGFEPDSTPIKLNAPQLNNTSVVFEKSLVVDIRHPVKGTEIRYTTDGSEPDSIHSPVFKAGTVIDNSAVIKAKAYKKGWISSETQLYRFFRSTYTPDSIHYLSRPTEKYRGDFTNQFYDVLFDGKMGDFILDDYIFNLNSGQWVGFTRNDMELMLYYDRPVQISSVGLHALIISGRSVFPPATIEIWGGTDSLKMKLLSRMHPKMPTGYGLPEMQNVVSRFNATEVSCLKIVAKPLLEMPGWHKSKGRPALTAIDEIFIN